MANQNDNTINEPEMREIIERNIEAEGKSPSGIERVNELQIRLEEIGGLARVVAETCDEPEFNGPLCVIDREIQAVRHDLNTLIPIVPFVGTAAQKTDGDAARDGTAYLPKVIDDLMTAVDLCGTLRGYLAGTHEDACMRAESVVRQIEKSVRKAWDRVDCEDMEHRRENPDVEDALSRLHAWEAKCEAMPIEECSHRLRMFMWDANEIMTAGLEEDGYSVMKTYTRKGLRYHLAQLEFLQELTEPETEGGAA